MWNDLGTWNLAAISPVVRSYTLGVGQMQPRRRYVLASGWFQDDWKIGSRLTLNLGVRYDFIDGAFGGGIALEPFLSAGRAERHRQRRPASRLRSSP